MKMCRVVMLVAIGCLAASSLIAAQGRGQKAGGPGPQITRGASGGPNVAGGVPAGGSRNAPVTPGKSGGTRGEKGATPGNTGNAGKNAGGAGRGKSGAGPGNDGSPSAHVGAGNKSGGDRPSNAGKGRSNQRGDNADGGRGNAGRDGGDADDDQGAPRGNRGHGSGEKNSASFVDRMNPQLRSRLEAMLPSGVTLEQAAEGFRNQGQFIAALQQSQNHDISFVDLKAQMTGDNPVSLGEAMRKLGAENDEN